MSDDVDVEEAGGLSSTLITRRNLIKAGAIVGGVVWTAPVIDSFLSPAGAQSEQHFCCSCYNPVSGLPFQGESDGTPPSVAACVAYCSGQTPNQQVQYQNFTWCGPSATGLTYSSTGLGGHGPGCYQSNGSPDTGCTSGTITYVAGSFNGYSVSNTNASGTQS